MKMRAFRRNSITTNDLFMLIITLALFLFLFLSFPFGAYFALVVSVPVGILGLYVIQRPETWFSLEHGFHDPIDFIDVSYKRSAQNNGAAKTEAVRNIFECRRQQ